MARWTRTAPGATAIALLAGALAGCAGDPGSVDDQGGSQVETVVAHAHRAMVAVRSRDPEGTGQAVVDAFTEETMVEPDATRHDADGTVHLTAAIAMEEVNADGTYGDEMLGACVTITATPGDAEGDVGQRGTVSTRQVECGDGLVPVRNDLHADRLVQGLAPHEDEVPLPIPPVEHVPCYSGSGDCPGG
ncbi:MULTISPECIES: hypothetical protein [Cellulomonas]|uniref:hypothetical protein n=1 Tax=Cellulomonas TaxID=1707 RepID=UPI0010A8E350|nr:MULTISPECIES: hypothetical protein [Cellulomonas]